jgi:hypothetical protein
MNVQSPSMKCALVALAVTMSGCVVSIEPIVLASDATLDARLLGTWEKDSERAVISRAEGDSVYAIDYTSGGETGRFHARLGRLGNRTVLDVWPEPREKELPDVYASSFVPAHLLLVVDIRHDEFQTAGLDDGMLRTAILKRQVRLTDSGNKDRVILQGTTAQLRAALGPYLSRPKALGNSDTWRRAAAHNPDLR